MHPNEIALVSHTPAGALPKSIVFDKLRCTANALSEGHAEAFWEQVDRQVVLAIQPS